MGSEDSQSRPTDTQESKVARVLRQYGLEDMGDQLILQWRGQGDSRRSLRQLAKDVNIAILETAVRETGIRPIDGEIENMYRLLTSEEVGAAQRTEAETKLERHGLTPDRLKKDFVSHQAVHTYLREYRGVHLSEPNETDRPGRAAEAIQRIAGRLRSVTEQTLSRLEGDKLTLGAPDVFVSVEVYCDHCGRQFEIEELLSRGGCDCGPDRSA